MEHRAKVVDGNVLALQLERVFCDSVAQIQQPLLLVVIFVGVSKASASYIAKKKEFCARVGIGCHIAQFNEDISYRELLNAIAAFNSDVGVTGIIVQLPLPPHLDVDAVLNAVAPAKDVDGLGKVTQDNLLRGVQAFECCTPRAILWLLETYERLNKRTSIVLVGHGRLVGKPLEMLLRMRGYAPRICDISTVDIGAQTRQADVVISAVGHPHLLGADDVKVGAAVIDVGFSRVEGKITGDVDFENVVPKVSLITPPIGGIGPLTVAMLISNILLAYRWQSEDARPGFSIASNTHPDRQL